MQSEPQSKPDTHDKPEDTRPGSGIVEINVVRHRGILNLLTDGRALLRFLLTLTIILLLLIFGITVVVFSLKSIYPYDDIQTSLYGASTFKTEDKDVTYWLFNSAELWANSGIEVEKGDVLTIRTSGTWHSSLHHLVETLKNAETPNERYIDADGERLRGIDRYRSQFTIAHDREGILLLLVVPENCTKDRTAHEDFNGTTDFSRYILGHDFTDVYSVAQNTEIKVTQSGVLHFAVNDVQMTPKNIKKIYTEYLNRLAGDIAELNNEIDEKYPLTDSLLNKLRQWVDSLPDTWLNEKDTIAIKSSYDPKKNTITETIKINNTTAIFDVPYSKELYSKVKGKEYAVGPRKDINAEGSLFNNELIYYYNRRFIDPWYLDNLGSMLIVVEKKKKQ